METWKVLILPPYFYACFQLGVLLGLLYLKLSNHLTRTRK